MKKLAIPAAAAAVALAILPAVGSAQQDAPAAAPATQMKEGATVYGSDGSSIGTVIAARGDAVLVDTGSHQIPIPANAFATGEQGPTLAITKADLSAQIEKHMAEQAAMLDQVLTVGAEVKTADARPLGTVQTIEGADVVIATEPGPLKLPKKFFAVDQGGAPVVRATMAQINEAAAAAPEGR